MNFLGHLYFSNNNVQLQYANLFGDYVKGTDYSDYPDIIQKGVHLHRTIDVYIDRHPAVIDLLHELYPELPKISGIAVDLYFDHLLARHWAKFHEVPIRNFIDRFYNATIENIEHYSTSYLVMIERMKKHDWLFSYQTLDGLDKTCRGLSSRISFHNELSKGAEVFVNHEKNISIAFDTYMADAIPFFKEYFDKVDQ